MDRWYDDDISGLISTLHWPPRWLDTKGYDHTDGIYLVFFVTLFGFVDMKFLKKSIQTFKHTV